MTKKFLKLLLSFVVAVHFTAFAQEPQPEMADVLRSNGKIYTVVAVLGVVLAGLFFYLIITERKLSALEKHIKKS